MAHNPDVPAILRFTMAPRIDKALSLPRSSGHPPMHPSDQALTASFVPPDMQTFQPSGIDSRTVAIPMSRYRITSRKNGERGE